MNVLLVCYAGMSTSIMMKKMEEYAKTKDIESVSYTHLTLPTIA